MKKIKQTQEKLFKALIQILQDTDLEDISVASLCKKAHISRTTFYSHYSHPEDVLIQKYNHAHEAAFGTGDWSLKYLLSDQFIKDMINFFDQNTQLILIIMNQDLLSYVPAQRTLVVTEDLTESQTEIINNNSVYAMIYLWQPYFSICSAWIMYGKKESKSKLFHTIKQLHRLSEFD